MNNWYQMDLFDLEEKTYQPVAKKVSPWAISRTYHCPKCNEVVGIYIEDEKVWGIEPKEVCKNGHKMNWEAIK